MKMRVLTSTTKGKLLTLAERIAKKAEATYAVDVIPPAYSLERERLLVMVVTLKSDMPSAFNIFCRDLTRDRAANVAVVVDGTAEKCSALVQKLKDDISQAGSKFIDDVLYINGGLPFKFMKKTTPEEDAAVDAWTDRILSSIQ